LSSHHCTYEGNNKCHLHKIVLDPDVHIALSTCLDHVV